MGLRQQVIRRVVWAALCGAAPAVLATGCATFGGLSKDLHELSAAAAPPNPVAYVPCAWQNRVTHLPDPLRNGAPTPGVAGQVFLYDAKYQPAEAAGDLTVVVSDVTPRPPGQAGPTPEAWHFTAATLKNLRYVDERIGRCYLIFLPWPATWKDVARVRFQVRYDQPNGPTLYAQDAEVTLDFSPSPNGTIPGMSGGGSVPNPAEMLRQARAAQGSGRTPLGNVAQPVGSSGWPMPGVQPSAGVQPVGGPAAGYYPQQQQQQSPVTPASATYPPQGYYPPPQQGAAAPAAATYPPTGYFPPQPAPTNTTGMTYPPQGNYYYPSQVPGNGMTTLPVGSTAGGGVQSAVVPYRPAGTEPAIPGPPDVRSRLW
jgi:hypothetical protein